MPISGSTCCMLRELWDNPPGLGRLGVGANVNTGATPAALTGVLDCIGSCCVGSTEVAAWFVVATTGAGDGAARRIWGCMEVADGDGCTT